MSRTPPTSTRRRRRAVAWTAGVVLALVMVLPVVLSPVATSVVNRRLATLPGYQAQVGAVRIAPWKLAVEIDDLIVRERKPESDGPLVKVGHGTVTFLLSALMRGQLLVEGSIRDTEFLIYNAPPAKKAKKAEPAKEPVARWQRELQERFDVAISRFEITRTTVRFVDRSTPGNPELTMADVHLVATNLKARADAGKELPARVEVTGRFPGGGILRGEAALAPLADHPRFTTALEVKDLALLPLREFLQAYAGVDVRRGTFEVFIEAEAQDGRYAGYVKPFFRDLEFKALPDPDKGLIRNSATLVASAVTDLLKNEEQKIATKAPFQGEFGNTDVDLWETIQNLLQNAFVQSIREGFEGRRPVR